LIGFGLSVVGFSLAASFGRRRMSQQADSVTFDLLLQDCRLPDGSTADIGCANGRVAAIGNLSGRLAERALLCEGRAVTPGLVEAHIHLDKALLSDRTPSVEGTLQEAIRITAEAKRRFTVEDIRTRARAVLDIAVRQGTTAMRSHVEVDPIVGLRGLEALLPLKTEYAPALDLQLCAFAQEGILQSPGTEALLEEALRRGADLVGGCPYNDTDAHAQIDIVFRLARQFDVDADFHVDFFDEPEHLHVRYIAEQAVRYGWKGRVAVGHCTELGALPPADLTPIIGLLRDAGLGVITLPATDLYLMGRKDTHRIRRGLAPIKRLLEAGVPVAAATNNVRNAFTPVGNANLLLTGFLLTVAAHMGTERDRGEVLRMLTVHPARLLRLPPSGPCLGLQADLVVWEAAHLDDLVAGQAAPWIVVKRGRVTVEHERTVREPWRVPLAR
jgi:cytosine deaminase